MWWLNFHWTMFRLRSKNWKAQLDAMTKLVKAKEARAVPALIEFLRDPRYEARRFASAALGIIGDTRAVGPLIECLRDRHGAGLSDRERDQHNRTDCYELRAQIATSLGLLKDEAAIPLLVQVMTESPRFNSEAAEAAALALAEFGDRAVAPSIEEFKSADTGSRLRVQRALREVGSPATEKLKKALTDGDIRISAGAASVLWSPKDGPGDWAKYQAPDGTVTQSARETRARNCTLYYLGRFEGTGGLPASFETEGERQVFVDLLIHALDNDNSDSVQRVAAQELRSYSYSHNDPPVAAALARASKRGITR